MSCIETDHRKIVEKGLRVYVNLRFNNRVLTGQTKRKTIK